MKRKPASPLERNSKMLGFLLGLALPVVAFGLLYLIFEGLQSLDWVSTEGFRPKFRERTLSIIAIGLNALLLNYYQKRRATETMRGIAIITFVFVIIWLAAFSKYLF
ncbi:MAG: hypothetical protein D6816_15125 [Bacteroidetes bacterium]|nr:MAG: hypothetical protein D6816_15125 [Bacteroidota bacterium]